MQQPSPPMVFGDDLKCEACGVTVMPVENAGHTPTVKYVSDWVKWFNGEWDSGYIEIYCGQCGRLYLVRCKTRVEYHGIDREDDAHG